MCPTRLFSYQNTVEALYLYHVSLGLDRHEQVEDRGQTDSKLGFSGDRETDGKDLPVCICMCGSAHDCGCVVNGSNAMVAS